MTNRISSAVRVVACPRLEEGYTHAVHPSGLCVLVSEKDLSTYHASLRVRYGSTDRYQPGRGGGKSARPIAAAPMGLATHTVYVDGVKRGVVRYNENGKSLGWGAFSEDIYADIHLTLTKGTHILRIEKTEADVGFAELDAIDQIPCSLTGGVPAQDFKE